MHPTASDIDQDCRTVIKTIALLNPHVSLSDIAYLMDMPYDPEPFEMETLTTAGTPTTLY